MAKQEINLSDFRLTKIIKESICKVLNEREPIVEMAKLNLKDDGL